MLGWCLKFKMIAKDKAISNMVIMVWNECQWEVGETYKSLCILCITNLVTWEWQCLYAYCAKKTYCKYISLAMLPTLLLHTNKQINSTRISLQDWHLLYKGISIQEGRSQNLSTLLISSFTTATWIKKLPNIQS